MTLGEKQEIFSLNIALLIVFAYGHSYRIRCGDFFAHDGHSKLSCHYLKLAADLNLFKKKKYLTSTKSHAQLGKFWKSLHPLNRWGGDFKKKDGNHYSMEHNGRM